MGWRGQREWREEMEKLQYAALRKCTGAVLGARKSLVRGLAAVEDVETFARAAAGRFLAWTLCDPVRAGVATTDDPVMDGRGELSLGGACWRGKVEVVDLGLSGDSCKPAVFYCTLASIFLYIYLSITLKPHLRVTILFLSILYTVPYIFIMYYHTVSLYSCFLPIMFTFLILGRPYEVMDDPMRSLMNYEVIGRPMRSWGYATSFILFPDVISYDGQGRTARQTTMRSLLA